MLWKNWFFRITIQNVALETNLYCQAVPQLRLLVAGFPLRRSGFEPVSSNMGFLVDKVSTDSIPGSILFSEK
jgi:hypothetical protein